MPCRALRALCALAVLLAGCEARPVIGERNHLAVHPAGIMNPDDPTEFHGAILRDTGWRFESCMPCHGQDLSGGASGISCLACHQQGVTTCQTCHSRTRNQDGAHLAHIQGRTQGKALQCSECHVQPNDFRDPGHIYNADGSPYTGGVQVVFGALAGTTPKGVTRAGPPAWLPDEKTCANVYCHGGVGMDGQAKNTRPVWTADEGQAACGTCHGLPPQGHQPTQTRCFLCHNRTVDEGRALLHGGLHLDGSAEMGDGSGTCGACHGGAANPAPPRDIAGNTDISALGVGAHQAHVGATHRLRGPIPCADCHLMPAAVDSPGHIGADLPAVVFPGGGAGTLAAADGAVPVWDRGRAFCAGTYCHGGGKGLAADMSPDLVRAPVWTVAGGAGCGSCHGIPPQDAAHSPAMKLTDCAACHPATMDPSGAILVDESAGPGKATSAHINGVVDVVMKMEVSGAR